MTDFLSKNIKLMHIITFFSIFFYFLIYCINNIIINTNKMHYEQELS